MQRSSSSFKFWLTALGTLILVAGLATAYLVKTHTLWSGGAQYRLVGGQTYLAQDDESKQDADGMQKYGGNAAVIVAAYKRKLHSLFQGGNLAYLLAIASIILAAICFRKAWDSEES